MANMFETTREALHSYWRNEIEDDDDLKILYSNAIKPPPPYLHPDLSIVKMEPPDTPPEFDESVDGLSVDNVQVGCESNGQYSLIEHS